MEIKREIERYEKGKESRIKTSYYYIDQNGKRVEIGSADEPIQKEIELTQEEQRQMSMEADLAYIACKLGGEKNE